MARRPSKHLRTPRPLGGGTVQRTGGGSDWVVRTVAGAAAVKTYRCPGCNQLIAPGTPHVVAWAAEPALGTPSPVQDRRHWHTPCWARRQ